MYRKIERKSQVYRALRYVQKRRVASSDCSSQSYVYVPGGTQAMMLISSTSMPLVNVRITLVPETSSGSLTVVSVYSCCQQHYTKHN